MLNWLKLNLSSARVNQIRREADVFYRSHAQLGGVIQLVTAQSPNPKIAQLAHDLEAMERHPLAARFLKEKPEVYVIDTRRVSGGSPNDEFACKLVGTSAITISQSVLDVLERAEMKGIAGHEVAHVVQGDGHMRGIPFLSQFGRAREIGADRLGAVLSGNPSAMKAGMHKIHRAVLNYIDDWKEYNKQVSALPNIVIEGIARYGKRRLLKGNSAYQSLEDQSKLFDALAEQMKTPEGRGFLERIEAERLEKIHRAK